MIRKQEKTVIEIALLKEDSIRTIESLISTYKFQDYRFYKMLDKITLVEYLFNQVATLLKDNNSWVIAAFENKNSEAIGLATLSLLSWDTKHFGFKMAKIDHLIANGDYAKSISLKRKLLDYLLQLCKNEKIFHISCRIDAEDTSSIHALETNGFKVMDTLVNYVFNRYKHNIPKIKDLCKIRVFKKKDLPDLTKISKNAFHKDRFHLDHYIPNKKADSLFGEWIKNSCRGGCGDKVFVAERNSRIVGFLTFKLDKEIKKLSGRKIAGHGLSAVSSGTKGIYPSLVKAAVKEIALHYDCLEFDTQLINYEVIKVWQKFSFDFIRAKYTLHKWLGN